MISSKEAFLAYSVPVDSGGMDTVLTDLLDECMDSECLGSMTPETQDIYLRLDSHQRRSGLRLARIIARQQLLKKISQGIFGLRAGYSVIRLMEVWMAGELLWNHGLIQS
ncbi:StAR-related lipid transfer protein 13 [Anabarilius grahami]|uniref:StAR-related lipid transfer protein 13 n=1 Tax=Anabarilius grahami TaxID=495550 RepID=A0A3N0Z723_ANAGA|nr:StAR-related lipid transfer protein 13 [Anabarilius grahami]